MNEDPVVVWGRIERSPFAFLYLNELHWLATGVVEACVKVFGETATAASQPADKHQIRVDPTIHRSIYQALGDAARIRWLLTDRPRRKGRNGESALQHGVQEQRTEWLRRILKDVTFSQLDDPDVRHSLEHFDEKLDSAALAGIDGTIALPTWYPLDLVQTRGSSVEEVVRQARPSEDPTVYPLRVYLAEERVFVNAGKRVNLQALHDDCAAIRDAVAARLQEGGSRTDLGTAAAIVMVGEWPEPPSPPV